MRDWAGYATQFLFFGSNAKLSCCCKIESWYSNIEIIKILMYEIQRDRNIHACTNYSASEVCATTEGNCRGILSWKRIITRFYHKKKSSWEFIVEENHHGTLLQKRIIAVLRRRKNLREILLHKRIIGELRCKKESL